MHSLQLATNRSQPLAHALRATTPGILAQSSPAHWSVARGAERSHLQLTLNRTCTWFRLQSTLCVRTHVLAHLIKGDRPHSRCVSCQCARRAPLFILLVPHADCVVVAGRDQELDAEQWLRDGTAVTASHSPSAGGATPPFSRLVCAHAEPQHTRTRHPPLL